MAYEASRPPSCTYHSGRRAKAACVGCGDYVCGECLRTGESGALCPRCAGEPRAGKNGSEGPAVHGEEEAPGFPWDTEARPFPPASPQPEAATAARGACSYHPAERAVSLCSHCAAPVCMGCRREAGGNALCPDCFNFIAKGKARPFPVTAAPPAGAGELSCQDARWKLWPGLAFLPFPFLLEFAITYMINQGGEVSLGAAVLFISTILYATLLAFAAWQVGGQPGWTKKLGVTGRNLKAGLSWGALAGLASFGFTAIFLALSVRLLGNWEWVEKWLKGLMEINVKAGISRVDLVVAFVVVVLIGPICEEAFFRGYLYPPMRREMGAAPAILLNAVLFSLVHFSLFGLLSRVVAGCIFCALYEYTDNLAAPVTAHVLSNLIAFILPVVSL